MEGYRGLAQTAPVYPTYPVLPQSLAPQPEPAPYEFNTPRGLGLGQSQIARGIQSAYSGTKAGLQGYGASIADALGAQDLAAEWYANAEANAHQAELIAPRVRTIGAIQNPNDALDYGLGKVGEFAPYLVAGGGLGLLGRGVGAVAGLRGAELARAAHLTAAAGFQPMMAGEQALTLHNDPAARNMSPQEVLARSQGVGAAQAYVGAAVPAMMGGQLVTRTAAPTLGQTLGRAASNSIAGGAGIAGMDVIGQMHRTNYDPEYQYNPVDTGEAFAGGVAGMLPIAGAHGAITHGLDKGVELPGKAYEASKTEAQRLYETAKQKAYDAIDLIPDEVKDYVKRSADYVVQQDLKAGEYWDEHLAPEMEALGTVGAAAKELFLSNVKATAEELNAARKRGTSVAEVEGIVGEAGHKLNEQLGVATEILRGVVPEDTLAAKLLGKVKSDDEAFKALGEVGSEESSWLSEGEKMSPDRLAKVQKELAKPEVLEAYLNHLHDLFDQGGGTEAQVSEVARLASKAADAANSGKALSSTEVKQIYWLGRKVKRAQDESRDILNILPKFEDVSFEDKNTRYSGETRQNFARTNLADVFRKAKVEDETTQQVLRTAQDQELIRLKPQRYARELVKRALAKRYGIEPEQVQAGGEFDGYYNAVLPALQKAYSDLVPNSSAAAQSRQQAVSERFRSAVREHITDLFKTTEFGKDWLAKTDGGETEINALADFFTGVGQGKKTHGHAAQMRVLTHLRSRFMGEHGTPGEAHLTERPPKGAPKQEVKLSPVDEMLFKIADAADTEFGVGSTQGNNILGGDTVKRMAAMVVAALKPPPKGTQRSVRTAKATGKMGAALPEGSTFGETYTVSKEDYALVEHLLKDLDETVKIDGKRRFLRDQWGKLSELWAKAPQGSDERFNLRETMKQITAMLDRGSYTGLKNEWVKQGLVTEKTFDRVLGLLEQYSEKSGRLSRPETRRSGNEGDANRVVEDPNDIDKLREQFEASVNEGRNTDTEASVHDDSLTIRNEQNRGFQGEVEGRSQFIGSQYFKDPKYDPSNIGAPVNLYPASDHVRTWNPNYNESSALGALIDSTYNNGRVGRRSEVSVQDWATELANTVGGTVGSHMTRAMEALLAHSKERLKNLKADEQVATHIGNIIDLAEKLKRVHKTDNVGTFFFANELAKNYRYHKLLPHDASNLSYTAEQLINRAGIQGETVADWAERRAENSRFSPEVFENSVLTVRIRMPDGKGGTISTPVKLDVAKLVAQEMAHHQPGDITGVGVKQKESSRAEEIETAFSNVIATILGTEGVVGLVHGNKFFGSEDARTNRVSTWPTKKPNLNFVNTLRGLHFADNLVVFREETPRNSQMVGEAQRRVAPDVPQAFTFGDLGKGYDRAPDGSTITPSSRKVGDKRVEWSPGELSKQHLEDALGEGELSDSKTTGAGFVKAETSRGQRERERDNTHGIANRGVTKDGLDHDVNVTALLSAMLERNGIDPIEALRTQNLPEAMVAGLLHEAFAELKERGYDGDLLDMSLSKYDHLVAYHKVFGDKREPIYFKRLKTLISNAREGVSEYGPDGKKLSSKSPIHNLEDAQAYDVLKRMRAADYVQRQVDQRLAKFAETQDGRGLKAGDTAPSEVRDRIAEIEKAYRDYDNWAYADWRDEEIADPSTFEKSIVTKRLEDAQQMFDRAAQRRVDAVASLKNLNRGDPEYNAAIKSVATARAAELKAKAALEEAKPAANKNDRVLYQGEAGEEDFAPHRNPGAHEVTIDQALERVGMLEDYLGNKRDVALFDKSEMVGGERKVEYGMTPREAEDKQAQVDARLAAKTPAQRQADAAAREAGQKLGTATHALEVALRAASGDPTMQKFLRETFFMPFLDPKGEKISKEFQAWMDKNSDKISAKNRADFEKLVGDLVKTASERAKGALEGQRLKFVTGPLVGPRPPYTGFQPTKRGPLKWERPGLTKEGIAAEAAARKAALQNGDAPTSEPSEISKDNRVGAMNTNVTSLNLKYEKKPLKPPKKIVMFDEAPKAEAPKAEAPKAKSVNDYKGEYLARILSTSDASSETATINLIDTLTSSKLHDVAINLPAAHLVDADGATRAGQFITMLSEPSKSSAKWAKEHLARANLRFNEESGKFESTKSETFSEETATYGDQPQASEKDLNARIKQLVGDEYTAKIVSIIFKGDKATNFSGKLVNKIAEIAAGAPNRMSTLHHEAWHVVEGMLKEMGPHGEKILGDIYAHMNTPLMKVWLEKNYKDPGVSGQLDSMSERAAFVFQKLSEGVKMPVVAETKSILQHMADFVRWVGNKVGFKTTTAQERSDNFMDYVMKGDFARDMDNAASVRKGLGEKSGDNIVHQAGQILKPGLEALSAVFQHTSARIADLKIPEYDTVMELLTGAEGKGGYMNDKRRMEYAFDNEIGEQIKGMSDKDRNAFLGSKEYAAFQGRIATYMENAGVTPGESTNFYKRLATLNADAIGKDIEAFITDLVNHGGFKGKAGEARTLANQIADRGFYYNKDRDLFPNRPDLKDKWEERDFTQSVARYIQQAVYLAERTRERTGNDGKKYRMSDLKSLLEAGNAKADSKGQQLMEDTLAAYEGTLASDKMSPGLRKFMGSLLFINNVRLLPKAVFSQMLEPMQLALRKGSMSGTLDTLWRGIREMPRSFDKLDAGYTPDKWERLANQIGTAPSRIIANVMAQMQNGMTLPGKIGHWNDQFFKLNFMDQWNRSMHIEATKHGVEFLKEHAEIVRNSKNADLVERSRRYLNELGVKESDIKVDGDGGLYIDVTNVGSDRVARAISQYVSEAMAHPDAGSNPMWMNDPRFALLAQMKRFTFAHSKYVLDRGIKEYKLGNAFPLVPAVLAMPWMLAADGLRDTLTMADTSYKNNWGILDHMQHAWSRAGHAGRGQFFGDMEQSIRHGGSGIEGFAGPTAELFGRISRGAHTGAWFDSMVNQVPGAPMIMLD